MIIFFIGITLYTLRNIDIELMLNGPQIFLIIYFASTIIILAGTILLTISVYLDAKQKKLNSKGLWTALSFIFGLPVLIIYAIFTRKSRTNGYNETSIKCFGWAMILIFILGAASTFANNFNEIKVRKDDTAITFYDDNGQKVIYDKMGISYPLRNESDKLYYSKDGKTYIYVQFKDGLTGSGYKCIETDEEFTFNSKKYIYIDKNGWAVEFEQDKLHGTGIGAYCDDDKNVYYHTSRCYWNSNGDLIFPQKYSELETITYDDIMKKIEIRQAESKSKYAVNRIENFFDCLNDKDFERISLYCTDEAANKYINSNSAFGFKSAKLIKIMEHGYIDNNENRYYAIVKLKTEPTESSQLYNPNNEKITLVATVYLQYTVYEEANLSTWKISDITFETDSSEE